ncbi:MAG: cation transporter [Gammaproteobacteria bacterium (ex Lamellibrachia satsuma)]|nr:MAG: cation transporter [Gammaproteobacteria bacterium (ex Lamellibrachia satsuma)]
MHQHQHLHHEMQEMRYKETRLAALVGAVVNLVLAFVKILFGWLGQSQSLLADGVHSLSDLLSDALVWFAARHAKEAPDEQHPYGHGRFETAGTMALGALLGLVGLGVIWDAAERLFAPEQLLTPSSFTLYVAAFSILANEGLYHYTQYLAQRINSNLLRANAWHHRSDSISSVVVLVGIGGTLAGLPYLDAIAAVLVGVMIVHIGWNLGWGAMQELVDAGLDEETVAEIRGIIDSVSGVNSIHMLRTRRMGGHASADVHVQVDSWLSVSEGHRIAEVVQTRLINEVEELFDVTVHIDPEDDEINAPCGELPLRQEAERLLDATCRDVACYARRQRLVLHYLSGRIDVDLYLPVDCFEGEKELAQLRQAFQKVFNQSDVFGKIRLWFGE